MYVSMTHTIQEEWWRWLRPIIEGELTVADVVKVCPHSARSLKRWNDAYNHLEHCSLNGKIPAEMLEAVPRS